MSVEEIGEKNRRVSPGGGLGVTVGMPDVTNNSHFKSEENGLPLANSGALGRVPTSSPLENLHTMERSACVMLCAAARQAPSRSLSRRLPASDLNPACERPG